jgi:poly-gamma-glutamate capsule biosynthesis protein CapA/YwtB (metallophosphatase superfamily)
MDRGFRCTVKTSFAMGMTALGLCLLAVAALHQPTPSAKLAFIGDVMLGRDVARANVGGDQDQILVALRPCTTTADIAFANLESPLTTAPLIGKTYDLRADPSMGTAISSAGIDIVSLSNNHALDAGPNGLQQTQQTLLSLQVQPIGPDASPWVTKANGLSLMWFAFDDSSGHLDLERAEHTLAAARSRDSLLIVSIHWGAELDTAPNDRQRYVATALAEAGADLIVGHHPHVLQPVQWLWGPGRGRPTLVAFSLGNAVFDQTWPPGSRYVALLQVDLGQSGVTRVCAAPFQLDPRTWQVIPASPTAAKTIARSLGLACILTPNCAAESHP